MKTLADQIIRSFRTEKHKWLVTRYTADNDDFLGSGKYVSLWIANGRPFFHPTDRRCLSRPNSLGGKFTWRDRWKVWHEYKKMNRAAIVFDGDEIEAEIQRILDGD